MDPALRPRPVSSLTSGTLYNSEGRIVLYYRNPIKFMCTTRLNDGIFTVNRFSVATSARLRQSECVFRFFVYGRIFDNPSGFLSARGTGCFFFFFFFFFFLFSFFFFSFFFFLFSLFLFSLFLFSFFFLLDVNSGAPIPRRRTAHREGRRISFV
jgi:hypothetical protein